MHPIVARIHPSYRTAFFAWFVARGGMVAALYLAGLNPLDPQPEVLGLMQSVWAAVGILNDNVNSVPNAGTWTLLIAGELAMILGGIALFRVVRRQSLPHVAERATWLWFASPVMLFVAPASPWCFALGAALWALECVSGANGRWGAFLAALAILIRPEAALIVPLLFVISLKNRTHADEPWLVAGLPVVAFSALVFGTMFISDTPRVLYESGHWRTDWSPQAFLDQPGELGLLVGCAFVLLLVIAQARRLPQVWLLLAVPLLLWPVLQEPSAVSAAPLLLGAPLFAHLALATENPSLERPVFGMSLVLVMLLPFLA